MIAYLRYNNQRQILSFYSSLSSGHTLIQMLQSSLSSIIQYIMEIIQPMLILTLISVHLHYLHPLILLLSLAIHHPVTFAQLSIFYIQDLLSFQNQLILVFCRFACFIMKSLQCSIKLQKKHYFILQYIYLQRYLIIKMKEKIKAGSPFLFGLISILNFVYGLSAIVLFALSIWLWSQFSTFSWVELAFMGLGVVQMLLVLLGVFAKKSTARMKLFLYLISLIFILQLTAAIVVFATGDSIIDQIVDKADAQEQWNKLKQNLVIVNYFVIGTLIVQLLLIMFVKCYIGSLKESNSQYDYKIVDDQGNKMTVQQKRKKDEHNVHEKYQQKRQQMRNKYGNKDNNN